MPGPADFNTRPIERLELEALKGFGFVLIENHVIHLNKHRLVLCHAYQLLMRTGLNSSHFSRHSSLSYSL